MFTQNISDFCFDLITIFFITGDRWKNRRRLLTPAFHVQHVNSFVNIFNEKSVDTARQMEHALDIRDELDVFPIVTQCALDILCGKMLT